MRLNPPCVYLLEAVPTGDLLATTSSFSALELNVLHHELEEDLFVTVFALDLKRRVFLTFFHIFHLLVSRCIKYDFFIGCLLSGILDEVKVRLIRWRVEWDANREISFISNC